MAKPEKDFTKPLRNRPETGPMQFGPNEWRGLFIRGDNAMGLMIDLQVALETDTVMAEHTRKAIESVLEELHRSNHHTSDRVQMMKPFKECFIEDKGERPNFS